MIDIKGLEIDYYKSKKFWDLTEEQRYEYFKNFMVALLGSRLIPHDEDEKKAFNEVMTQLALLIVFLTTTDQERNSEVELRWMNRFTKETEITFVDTCEGKA
tara:strand:- start:84 stop:389 length:306 start_codon:yes stop_codon:yes gene_type:complete